LADIQALEEAQLKGDADAIFSWGTILYKTLGPQFVEQLYVHYGELPVFRILNYAV
jgi:hypothetical protein